MLRIQPENARSADRATCALRSSNVWRATCSGADDVTLEDAVHSLLQQRGWKVATAESCTGGRVAATLTSRPGSSRSFAGGIVAYDDAAKIEDATGWRRCRFAIERDSSVEREAVARAMARGARERLRTQLAIADDFGDRRADLAAERLRSRSGWYGSRSTTHPAARARSTCISAATAMRSKSIEQLLHTRWECSGDILHA